MIKSKTYLSNARNKFDFPTSLIGVSLVSAVGSLPLHLSPLIIVTAISDSKASIAEAGWIPSFLLIGQLFSSVVLPAFAIRQFSRYTCMALGAGLMASLGLSATATNFTVGLIGWFLAGQCCGAFMYTGTLAAAQNSDKTLAFLLRLALVLMLAGVSAGLLFSLGALHHYNTLIYGLITVIVFVLLLGILIMKPLSRVPEAASNGWFISIPKTTLIGLAVIFFFFTGQTGFLTYVIHYASSRGMPLGEAVLALVVAKFLAGLWVLLTAIFAKQVGGSFNFLNNGLMLAIISALAIFSSEPAILLAALFVFEILLNGLSARLQGLVATEHPNIAGRWLTAAVLLGAATGPALNGIAIANSLEFWFLVVTFLSALAPCFFQIITKRVAFKE